MVSFGSIIAAVAVVFASRFAWLVYATYLRSKPLKVPGVFFIFGLPWRFIFPNVAYLNPKAKVSWSRKWTKYDSFGGLGVYKTTHVSRDGRPILHIADPVAVKQLSLNRKAWAKPTRMYQVLSFFGQNLVITEGNEWKIHRKVVGPSFSEKAYDLVWRETAQVYKEMVHEEGWESAPSGTEFQLTDLVDITMRIALLIISRAAFNIDMPWKDADDESKKLGPGHTMTSSHALHLVSTKTLWKILTPKWAYYLPIPAIKLVGAAFSELDDYMLEMVQARREALQNGDQGKADLFGSLVLAGMENAEKIELEGEEGNEGLGDREIIGNTFIFLLAGHETSGHSLGFVFALLALHPEIQEELYKSIIDVMPEGYEPTYEDYPKLTYALAVLYETIRLFPPVTDIPKTCMTDTTLTFTGTPDPVTGEMTTETVFVPEGTDVLIDTPALHTNPHYWKDPLTFDPTRFLPGADWNRDAFVPFSAGPRACIGRRFAEVEAVATLALFIRGFEFKLPALRKGETKEAQRQRLLKARPAITLTPKGIDLIIRKR